MAANMQGSQELIFLLLGKTGSGKSAVGNSILGKKKFESSSSGKSVTSSIMAGWAKTDKYDLMVIDGPGLEDTELKDLEDKERACSNLDIALGLTRNGVHVFVLVMKYPVRMTREEKSTIHALGKILGPKWLSHYGVVVMTCGNQWHDDMEDAGKNITFIQWCKETNASYDGLFAACNYRCVLFENRRATEGQVQQQFHEITSFAEQVKEKYGRYTNEHFQVAAASRDQLIVQIKAPLLKADIQKNICLLHNECVELSNEQPYGEKMKSIGAIIERVNSLLQYIDKEDKGTGELSDLKQEVQKLKENVQKTEQSIKKGLTEAITSGIAVIKQSAMQIEATRKDSSLWSKCTRALKSLAWGAAGTACAGIAVATGGLAPVAGAIVGGLSHVMGYAGAGAALTSDDTQTETVRVSTRTLATMDGTTGTGGPIIEEIE